MVNIIVAFSSQKDGINIRNLLMRHGHNVVTVCTNGAAVSQAVDQMEGSDGIVVSGYKYQDMTYSDLLADLPDTWQMIVMASPGNLSHILSTTLSKFPCRSKSMICLQHCRPLRQPLCADAGSAEKSRRSVHPLREPCLNMPKAF